jgi:hypothetical protein
MNPALLQIIQAPPQEREGALALIQEYLIDPRSYPYLVSASKNPLLWVERPLMGRLIRAFLRRDQDVDLAFQQVLTAVTDRGVQYNYGNVFPYSEEGIQGALKYVGYFLEGGDTEVINPLHQLLELLVPEGSEWAELEYMEVGVIKVPVQVAKWLPEKTAVAVPLDRGFLGDIHLYGNSSCAIVVHNPTRGMAIARDIEVGDG